MVTYESVQVVGLQKDISCCLIPISDYRKKQASILYLGRQRGGCAQADTFHICREPSLNCSQISPSIDSPRHAVQRLLIKKHCLLGSERVFPFHSLRHIFLICPSSDITLLHTSFIFFSGQTDFLTQKFSVPTHKSLPFSNASTSLLQ